MPYPESCPECASTFRNTGTHFTARRNEVGRHVLLELGCQTTNRRFWWDFTTGQLAGVTTTTSPPAAAQSAATPASEPRLLATAGVSAVSNGSLHANGSNGTNGNHGSLSNTRPTTTTAQP